MHWRNIREDILEGIRFKLSFHEYIGCHSLVSQKEMAPHSSTLAWKIPWTEEPGRLQSTGSLRVCIGEGHGNPLQYSCLENPRDRGAWWAAVYGVAQSRTRDLAAAAAAAFIDLYCKQILKYDKKYV